MLHDTPGTSEIKQYAHPIMDYNYVFADPILGGELTWNTNALSFSSNQDPTAFAPFADSNQQMNRVVTELNWRRRFTDPIGITYTPFAQLRGDLYQISNYFDPHSTDTAPLQETSFARGLALGGVTVAYPWVANTREWLARHRADRPDHRAPGHRSSRTTCRTRMPRASSSTTPTCSR